MACENKQTVLSLDDWSKRWDVGKIGFHRSEKHAKLERFIDALVHGRTSIKFLFPLCGKAVDMKWMYDEGHEVVGIEGSAKGIEEFFSESGLAYTAEAVDEIDGTVYKSEDGRLRLYCCDFYRFTSNVEKDFGAVFDRGSFVAINVSDRKRYADTILPLLAKDCRYMLITVEYDGSKYPGPPHTSSFEDIEAAFGHGCNLDLINVEDGTNRTNPAWGLDKFDERVVILTLKGGVSS